MGMYRGRLLRNPFFVLSPRQSGGDITVSSLPARCEKSQVGLRLVLQPVELAVQGALADAGGVGRFAPVAPVFLQELCEVSPVP